VRRYRRDVHEQPRPPLIRALGRWRSIAIDTVVALLLAAVLVAASEGREPPYGIPQWVGLALVGLAALSVAARRLWPLAIFAIALIAESVAIVVGSGTDPFIAVVLVLYIVALRLPRRTSAAALAVAVAATLAALAASPDVVEGRARWTAVIGQMAIGVALLCASWTIGVGIRVQRAYADSMREQATRQAVTDERLRIARELHDVVAHSMSVIAVKAGVGNYVADSDPEQARLALRDIEATSRSALTELRHLLGVLRSDTEGPAEATLAPAPRLADLDQLVAQAAAAGADVSVRESGRRRDLPAGVDLTAYRIVQEALTNMVKHAAPTNGTVTVAYGEQDLAIEVADDGPPTPTVASDGTGGHGLIGMRERVALYGGEFSAGPLPGRGFQVRAVIPISGGMP
jgi:signal transduction histidine kinase